MKTTILPTFSRSLTRVMTALLLLTSACDRGGEGLLVDRDGECSPEGEPEPTEAETLAYSKAIVVSNGHNEVRLLVASDDPELIEHYTDESFELTPVFDRPELPESEERGDDQLDPAHDFSDSVLIEESAVSLEDGAVGYQLREVDAGFRHAIQTCDTPKTYTSPADFVRLEVVSGPCTEARISTKWWLWSWYAEQAHRINQCVGMPALVGGKELSSSVKLEICPGPSRNITFFN